MAAAPPRAGALHDRGVIVFGALSTGALASATGVRWSFAAGGLTQLGAALVKWTVLGRLGER